MLARYHIRKDRTGWTVFDIWTDEPLVIALMIGALIIQAMNTGILVSGFRPEFNLIVKAGMIILILLIQSPLAGRIFTRRLVPAKAAAK